MVIMKGSVIVIYSSGLQDKYQVALYIRLSREDGDKEESNSVTHQKSMLSRYVEEHEDLSVYDIYIDDGYTGTNFNRPGFQRMLGDIRKTLINCVLVKDLSRFGRDYIESGHYIERYFVDYNIRFVAINDNIDSLYSEYDLIMPIKNVFNQQYALDISNKVQSAFKAKQREGEFIGAFACYGYQRSATDKHKLIIDECAAEVVRRIFRLYSSGIGKLRIAKLLNEESILCPSEYKFKNGMNYHNSNKMISTNYWTYSTIHNILNNQMYLGDMVQGKTKRRMKGKAKYLPKEQWIIVKDKHPAIIDQELWEKVQIESKRDVRNIDFNQNVGVFAGFIRCGDCGRALSKNVTNGKIHYVCGSYKNYGKDRCSSHRIEQCELETVILYDLNYIITRLLEENEEILTNVVNQSNHINQKSPEIEIKKLDNEIKKMALKKKKAYGDYLDELINREDYVDYKNMCEKKMIHLQEQKKSWIGNEEKEVEQEYPLWIKQLLENKRVDKLDRIVISEMIDTIYVYENHSIRIIYNYEVV